MSTLFVMTVEVELPDDVSDEYQDAMVDDLADIDHIEHLERLIKKWIVYHTGERCHVTVAEAK